MIAAPAISQRLSLPSDAGDATGRKPANLFASVGENGYLNVDADICNSQSWDFGLFRSSSKAVIGELLKEWALSSP